MLEPAVTLEGLGKLYRIGEARYHGALRDALAHVISRPGRWLSQRGSDGHGKDDNKLWAVRDVSFFVNPGEVVGIIGRNGAGKTTLLKLLARITAPTEGRAELHGSVASLLEVGAGFHPELTGRENVLLNGAILGMGRIEIRRKFDEIVEFSGISRFIDTPVKHYSSGMVVRLAFSVAAHLDPDILLVDEILAVGDAEFQQRCLTRMENVVSSGRTVLFVSHNMASVLRICPRVILMDHGRVIADGRTSDVIRLYLETGLGTSAIREWESPSSAPGDDIVRLRAVRVRSDGRLTEQVDIRRPIDVEVEYWHLSRDQRLRPGIVLAFANEQGLILFTSSTFQDSSWHSQSRAPGIVRGCCRIPGNFLSEGQVTVHAGINSVDPPMRHLEEHDVVAFHVVDQSSGDAVRGRVGSDWPGFVRPMLDWTINFELDSQADACAREADQTTPHR